MLTAAQRLLEILKQNPGPQMSYQVAFCFWLLTFEQSIAEQIDKWVITLSDLDYKAYHIAESTI